MQRKLTVPAGTYYIGALLQLFRRAAQKARAIRAHLGRRWYCSHCEEYHSRRTVEFDYADGLTDSVCSLGMEAMGIPYEKTEIKAGCKERVYLSLERIEAAHDTLHRARSGQA